VIFPSPQAISGLILKLPTRYLGNIRLSFTDKNNDGLINNQGEVLQENHYYPFGMVQSGSWYDDAAVANNPYLYNNKELTTDFGLNLSDYGARGYDAAIGRWWQVDPLAEKYYAISPCAYVTNSPFALAARTVQT
jgi:RHS repeat-associated protein